jgi:hypothetical protein
VWAFRHFTFQDEPLCILEFSVGSMPGLFCHLLASCLNKIVHNCTRLIVYYQDSKGSAVGDNRNPGHANLLQGVNSFCLLLWMDKFQDRWRHSSDVDQLG